MLCSNILNIAFQRKKKALFVRACLYSVSLFLAALFTPITYAENSEIVLVNSPLSNDDTRYDYPNKLLSKILIRTEQTYGLQPAYSKKMALMLG